MQFLNKAGFTQICSCVQKMFVETIKPICVFTKFIFNDHEPPIFFIEFCTFGKKV